MKRNRSCTRRWQIGQWPTPRRVTPPTFTCSGSSPLASRFRVCSGVSARCVRHCYVAPPHLGFLLAPSSAWVKAHLTAPEIMDTAASSAVADDAASKRSSSGNDGGAGDGRGDLVACAGQARAAGTPRSPGQPRHTRKRSRSHDEAVGRSGPTAPTLGAGSQRGRAAEIHEGRGTGRGIGIGTGAPQPREPLRAETRRSVNRTDAGVGTGGVSGSIASSASESTGLTPSTASVKRRRRGRPRLPSPMSALPSTATPQQRAEAARLSRRREQNRISAHRSRNRIRTVLESTLERVEELRQTNRELRVRAAQLQAREAELAREAQALQTAQTDLARMEAARSHAMRAQLVASGAPHTQGSVFTAPSAFAGRPLLQDPRLAYAVLANYASRARGPAPVRVATPTAVVAAAAAAAAGVAPQPWLLASCAAGAAGHVRDAGSAPANSSPFQQQYTFRRPSVDPALALLLASALRPPPPSLHREVRCNGCTVHVVNMWCRWWACGV